MTPEDKLGTLEEAIEFDRKRNYQYTKPHRHAELIKAWADGVEIEERYATDYDNTKWGHWKTFDGTWMDGDEWQYRIKPAKSELEEILDSAIRQVVGRYLTEDEENLVDILKSYKRPKE